MAKITIDEERCKGCALCEPVCPKKIVKLKQDKLNSRGFHPAGITDESLCTGCAFCAIMCPDTLIIVEK